MVTSILKCNSINNPLIISIGIGDFEFSHSLGDLFQLKINTLSEGLGCYPLF